MKDYTKLVNKDEMCNNCFFLTYAGFAQSNIEVVQYSAEFVKENEISLKPFRQYDTKTLYMSKSSSTFCQT